MGANLHRKDNYADFAFLEEESHSVAYNSYIRVYAWTFSNKDRDAQL